MANEDHLIEPTNSEERFWPQSFNTWMQTANSIVQIVGILVAAVWAGYTFVWKEFWVPASAPVNITLKLDLKKSGITSTGNRLIAIEMRISASNPSSRVIHLIQDGWYVYADKLVVNKDDDDKAFYDHARRSLNSNTETYEDKFVATKRSVLVAAGHAFNDTALKPGETISRTEIFHIPAGEYDILDATVRMPSATDADGIVVEWTVDENWRPHPTPYRASAGGGRQPLKTDKNGFFLEKDIGFQYAGADSRLSLWD
jgi:hypothetical protein